MKVHKNDIYLKVFLNKYYVKLMIFFLKYFKLCIALGIDYISNNLDSSLIHQ